MYYMWEVAQDSGKGKGAGTWRRIRATPWDFCTGLEVCATLLCLKWVTSKGLLYSTWNSTQCYMPLWMGGKVDAGKWPDEQTAILVHWLKKTVSITQTFW